MPEQTQASDYTIWVVALLLYAYDAVKLLAPRELLLVEAGRGRLAAAFNDSPFTITGRALVLAPLLMPHRGVFVAPWGRAWTDRARLEAILASVGQLRGSLGFARIVAACGFALLFVAGPVLTRLLGPSAAIVYTAVLLYPTVLVAIGCVWWQRRSFGLGAAPALWLSVEILLCPAFLPNLVRKITARQPLEADGAQILVATASAEVKEEFLTRLENRTEELIEETSPDDAGHAQLRSYLATVKGAR